jgi:hypothetical protein
MMFPEVHRRQFLKLASVAAVGVAFSERNLFAATDSGIVPLLGVGYTEWLPENGLSVPMADASTILSPDPKFLATAARVSVLGGSRPQRRLDSDGGIGVDAYFPITGRDVGNYPRFSFWSASGASATARLSFRMPVLATTGLAFVVRRLRPTSAPVALNAKPPLENETSPLTLSLGNVEGPKLNRGIYAFAFREEASDGAPNWNGMRLFNSAGSYSLAVANVTYLLLQVEFDNAEQAIVPPSPSRNRASRH